MPIFRVQIRAFTVVAGKRPLSSMSPTVVFRDQKPYMVIGGSGGPTILTAVLQVFLNAIEYDFKLSDAVELPRIHHQLIPDLVTIENGVQEDVIHGLRIRNHIVCHEFNIVSLSCTWK